jgi:excisionase family DNA binding protein
MTTAEAAARLGITPEAVRKAIKRGRLVATKHGRDWLIDAVEVERYAATPKDKGGRPKKSRE